LHFVPPVRPSVRLIPSLTQKVKGKGRALVMAPQVDTATTEALRYMARTKQRRTYLPYIGSSRMSKIDGLVWLPVSCLNCRSSLWSED